MAELTDSGAEPIVTPAAAAIRRFFGLTAESRKPRPKPLAGGHAVDGRHPRGHGRFNIVVRPRPPLPEGQEDHQHPEQDLDSSGDRLGLVGFALREYRGQYYEDDQRNYDAADPAEHETHAGGLRLG